MALIADDLATWPTGLLADAGRKKFGAPSDPSWAKLVRTEATMDAAQNPIQRDLRVKESLTCTFVIVAGPTPYARLWAGPGRRAPGSSRRCASSSPTRPRPRFLVTNRDTPSTTLDYFSLGKVL